MRSEEEWDHVVVQVAWLVVCRWWDGSGMGRSWLGMKSGVQGNKVRPKSGVQVQGVRRGVHGDQSMVRTGRAPGADLCPQKDLG